MSSVEKAIVLALAYTDQFDYPLTAGELWLRLPKTWHVSAGAKHDDIKRFAGSLRSLVKNGILEHSQGYLFFAGRPELVQKRLERGQAAVQKIHEVGRLVPLLKLVPGIAGVALTGSLAMRNAKKDDDADFLIVTYPDWLWLVRPVVTLVALFKGKRRSWHKEEKNSWCFNMWLTTNKLSMPEDQRSIYGAYELCQALWLFSRRGTAQRYFSENAWAKKVLPAYFNHAFRLAVGKLDSNQGHKGKGSLFLISLLNVLAYGLQLVYMQSHRTREKVAIDYAFFHPRDTRRQVMSNWKKSLQKIEEPSDE